MTPERPLWMCAHTGGEGRREQQRGHRRRVEGVISYTYLLFATCICMESDVAAKMLYCDCMRMHWVEKGAGSKNRVTAAAMGVTTYTRLLLSICLECIDRGLFKESQ